MENPLSRIEKGDVLYSIYYRCKITVEAFTTDFRIIAVFFDEDDNPHREIFSLEELNIIESE